MWDQTTAGVGQSTAWVAFLVHFGKYPFLVVWFSAYVAYAFIGFGLWKLRNWARKAVLGLSIFCALASILIEPFFIRPIVLLFPMLVGMVLPCAWLIWYLERPRVRFVFGALTPAQTDSPSLEPPGGMSKVGKLLTATAAIATFAWFICSLLLAVENIMRHSQIYKITLSEAERSPCVAARVGQPLTPGWLVSGNIEESDAKGSAHLSIPVRGQKGKGDLVVSGEKQSGTWRIEELVLVQQGVETRLMPTPATCP